jgi:hypothetical protein
MAGIHMRSRTTSLVLSAAALGLAAFTFSSGISAQAAPVQAPTPAQGQRGAGAGRAGQAPARDTAPATPVGTGRISGSVVLGGSGTAIRRARVNLSGSELRGGRSAITDDQGLFSFDALPAGRFTMTVSKPGFVNMTYGAKRPGRPGTPIQLADGQRLEKVVITMPRGGVITGVVVDEHGEPSPGTTVRALRYQIQTGEKTLQQAGQDQTDDRGVYRIFQLQAGDYMVSAAPRNLNLGDVRQVLSAQIQALVAQTAQTEGIELGRGGRGGELGGRGGGGRGGFGEGPLGVEFGGRGARGGRGGALIDQLQQQLAQVEEEQALTYAPVYYPGTPSPSAAVTVSLAISEERSGVDFQLQLVPTARVTGTVTSTLGALPQGTQVALVPVDRAGVPNIPGQPNSTTRVNQDGQFTFQNITPGQYLLQARATVREAPAATTARANTPQGRGVPGPAGGGGRGGPGPIAQVLWAAADVTVAGQDVTGLALSLQPGMTVAGRIEFQGTGLPPPMELNRIRVSLAARGQQPFESGPIPPAEVDTTGQFRIMGVVPGRYALLGSIPTGAGARGTAQPNGRGATGPASTASWVLRSAMVGGRDVLDFPLEIGPNQNVSGASLIFTDRTQSLSGTIQDATGRPTADFTIILFPAQNQYWMPLARRIVSARPSTDGRFTFGSIPPGDYRLTAVTDVEPGEWYDPAFLSQLQQVSIPVSVGEGERKVQDIRLAGGM